MDSTSKEAIKSFSQIFGSIAVGFLILIGVGTKILDFLKSDDDRNTRKEIAMEVRKADPLLGEQYIEIFSKDPTPFTVKSILVNNRTGIQGCHVGLNKNMMQGDKFSWSFPSSSCGVLLSIVIETDKGKPHIGTWNE